MFGQDNPTNDTSTTADTSAALPFDPSMVSLNNDDAAASPATNPIAEPAADPVVAPSAPAADDNHLLTEGNDDLLHIKQQALQQLSPLVGHLEQTPEEKFRTTMMMIQASDDQSLVQTAYEAAQNITDDKTRAQALLDIVNEINYFTQQTPEE